MISLHIESLGICTSEFQSMNNLVKRLSQPDGYAQGEIAPIFKSSGNGGEGMDPTMLETLDPVSRLVFPAIDQAWRGAGLTNGNVAADRIGLLMYSAWGQVTTTSAYLESMFADQGRYASPRQFTRSVHSSPTAIAAIHFGIHGPCQTLVHDTLPVCCTLEQAANLLDSNSADVVIVCWADQASALATDICRRAVNDLHQVELSRLTGEALHGGAVAAVVSRGESQEQKKISIAMGKLQRGSAPVQSLPVVQHGAYPTDAAFHFATAGIVHAIRFAGGGIRPLSESSAGASWVEVGRRRESRRINFL